MSTDRLTEIVNYLSAISREIGEFRSEVNARFDRLETRVGRLEMETRESRMEMRAITTRFDRLESRVLEIRADTRDLDDRVSVLEGKPHAGRL